LNYQCFQPAMFYGPHCRLALQITIASGPALQLQQLQQYVCNLQCLQRTVGENFSVASRVATN